jgi:hypothetical protein
MKGKILKLYFAKTAKQDPAFGIIFEIYNFNISNTSRNMSWKNISL